MDVRLPTHILKKEIKDRTVLITTGEWFMDMGVLPLVREGVEEVWVLPSRFPLSASPQENWVPWREDRFLTYRNAEWFSGKVRFLSDEEVVPALKEWVGKGGRGIVMGFFSFPPLVCPTLCKEALKDSYRIVVVYDGVIQDPNKEWFCKNGRGVGVVEKNPGGWIFFPFPGRRNDLFSLRKKALESLCDSPSGEN
jgi:hypothetical protein